MADVAQIARIVHIFRPALESSEEANEYKNGDSN
jgi:hypothetical protein